MITSRLVALRNRAEKVLSKNPPVHEQTCQTEMLKLLHELEVYQVEMEMQAQEMWIAEANGLSAIEKLADVYESSLVGYITLCPQGKILEVNPVGSRILGIEGFVTRERYFRDFISYNTQPVFARFFSSAYHSQARPSCKLEIIHPGQPSVFVSLEGLFKGGSCQLTLKDITREHCLEEKMKDVSLDLKKANSTLHQNDLQIQELQNQVSQLKKKLNDKTGIQ